MPSGATPKRVWACGGASTFKAKSRLHKAPQRVNLDNAAPVAHDGGEGVGANVSRKDQALVLGPSEPSEQLVLSFPADAQALAASEHVHRWYDYTQGFEADLAARKLREHATGEETVVLDPFCGSGTTLVAAQFLGFQATGVDANPLMCLVSEAKTTWDVALGQFKSRAAEVLDALGRKLQEDGSDLSAASAIPMKSFNKWFLPSVLREVIAARQVLQELPSTGRGVKNLLRMAYAKALFESSQVSMCPGITFVKKPRPPLRVTLKRKLMTIAADLQLLRSLDLHKQPRARVFQGDARDLSGQVEADSIDVLFTSPPYPTDIEYTRQTRAELYFLGFIETMDDVRAIKKLMVRGSPKNIYKTDNNQALVAGYDSVQTVSRAIHEVTKDKNWGWDYPRMVREYFGDMFACLRESLRVLRPGGWALFVVGDQTCKGVKIPVTDVLRDIAADLGFADSYIETVRNRRSTSHSMSLPENIVALRKP
ncbi:MAG: site-specific DNA-methyltransferase [Planctomycetes bacterium]|nr:site-specific DNA-methyltransferase [Planctomycetota bacterium]